MPKAVEILKIISSNKQGVGFNEIISSFRLSSWEAYEAVLPLTERGLIFYALEKYQLNPLGKGVLQAVTILEDAVQGRDVVIYDISGPEEAMASELIDNISRN